MTLTLSLIAGILLLLLGGHYLVEYAVRLAVRLNVSGLVIGPTIVAFGTSAPELLVSLDAVLTDHDDIVMGNIIGSSIFNILGIAGVTALVSPVEASPRFLGTNMVILLAAGVGVIICGLMFGRLGRLAGGIMLIAYAGYLVQLG